MQFLNKIIANFKEINTVVVCDDKSFDLAKIISQVLTPYFSVGRKIDAPGSLDVLLKDVLILESSFKKREAKKKIKHVLAISKTPILVISSVNDFLISDIKEFLCLAPRNTLLALNGDNEALRKLGRDFALKTITFGFEPGADIEASDIHNEQDTNFKINYKGNIVPVWQKGMLDKERIYYSLAASCVGIALGLNLVQISEALKKQ